MSRPLRIEFPGALYHVTSRGDRREAIYVDESDRGLFLRFLGTVCERFNWVCHAYCLMTNHYHLVIETPEPNLSRGMRQLNGVFTQRFNRRHGRVGHVFQGRYGAELVDKESYLLELSRYVVLNPVRAGVVRVAGQWPWSSYRAMIGKSPCPDWLLTDGILARFSQDRRAACQRYIQFVADGKNQPSVWRNLRQQIYLGDENFVAKTQRLLSDQDRSVEIPKVQQRPVARTLEDYATQYANTKDAMRAAFATGSFTLKEIAEFFSVHYSTVSRAVKSQ